MKITNVPQPLTVPICRKNFQLVANFEYQWMEDGATFRIIIPKGFVSDGASVPRALWTLSGLSPDGLIRAAAWLHDFLYRYKGDVPHGCYQVFRKSGTWVDVQTKFSKSKTDSLFLEVMLKSGIPKRQAYPAYWGVCSFGWWSWVKDNRPEGV